jgi:hypothetical protein
MNIFGEDGPKFMGNKNSAAELEAKDLEIKKQIYMKHFMIDFIEHGLRKVVHNSSLECAKKAGYFDNLSKDLTDKEYRIIDQKFESCLGKYSDSYEHGLDIFGKHLGTMKKAHLI